jgi:hypothetical protein
MLKVSTWVSGSDGLLYRDPVIRGMHEVVRGQRASYFICFDSSEPPELVVSVHGRALAPAEYQTEAEEILRVCGLKAKLAEGPFVSRRCFAKESSTGPYVEAYAFFLVLTGPVPVDLLTPKRGAMQPHGPCVVYAPGVNWG